MSEPRPLKVMIVGAGIAGLSASIFLRQQGHRVVVLEQSRFASEVGAALHISPNAHGLVKRMGISLEKINGNLKQYMREYDISGTVMRDLDLTESNKRWQHEWYLIHRVHLHEELKRLATSPDGEGHPVELRTNSHIVEVDPVLATAVLAGGEEVHGDVILGADGIKSITRCKVRGGNIEPKPSGKSAFRFLLPRQAALDDPLTREFALRDGQLVIWFGEDRRVVMYPCDANRQLNFACIHPREESIVTGSSGEWNTAGSKSCLMEVYKKFHPSLLALLDKADADSLKVWELLDMDVLPTWVEGRLALLGDAAHPFLPHQGQGGACAIEDAASIGVVLQRGVKPEEVPDRLRLYEKCRMERAHKIQEFSRIAGLDLSKRKLDMLEYIHYNFNHDEWEHSAEELRKWSSAKEADT